MHATSRSTGGNRSEKKNTPNAETWQSCDWSIGAAYFFDAFLSLEIAATGTWILWSAAGDEEHERSNSVRYANALQFFGVSHGVRYGVQLQRENPTARSYFQADFHVCICEEGEEPSQPSNPLPRRPLPQML